MFESFVLNKNKVWKTNVAIVGKLTNDIHHLDKITWTNIDKTMHLINQKDPKYIMILIKEDTSNDDTSL